MQIVYVENEKEANEYIRKGFVPIECSFGTQSVVTQIKTKNNSIPGFDHHGDYSKLPAVSLQAALFFDRMENYPFDKFVVTGNPDLDACFCIAVLSGILKKNKQELVALAELVHTFDVDPIGKDLTKFREGLLFKAFMTGSGRDELAFYKGVGVIRDIINGKPNQIRFIELAAINREQDREKAALEDLHDRGKSFPISETENVLTIFESRVWGFDYWYGNMKQEINYGAKWKNPVVLALVQESNNITIGCPDEETAEDIFGVGGLQNVFPLLGNGWGGRSSIGGSPRGKEMTKEDLERAAKIVSLAALSNRRF